MTTAIDDAEQDYTALTPDTIIDATESLGLSCDARIFPLNSYENRVYQIGLEEETPVIGKFYRPHRWSDEQILEEHAFTQALADLEIPVVPPLQFNQQSLFEFNQYRFALYPRQGGRSPELDNADNLRWLGRFIG
ncbi:MAG: phosphotransferase, partial [Gammaproteobacteria bacterium]|nr:phosphotransferase [Gammaproteobacteria bacterium]